MKGTLAMKTSDNAKRVLSYAAYDCAQRGKALILPDHLLLGLYREDFPLIDEVLDHFSLNSIHLLSQLLKKYPESIRPSDERRVRFGKEAIHVLCLAEKEALRFNHKTIRPEHLFLGVLGYQNSFLAEYLVDRDILMANIRVLVSAKRFGNAAPQEVESHTIDEATLYTMEFLNLKDIGALDKDIDVAILRLAKKY